MSNYCKVVEFDNGFGLSIICNDRSYGNNDNLFEIALLKNGSIVYNKHFPDVLGWQDFADVGKVIELVKSYPAEMGCSTNLLLRT